MKGKSFKFRQLRAIKDKCMHRLLLLVYNSPVSLLLPPLPNGSYPIFHIMLCKSIFIRFRWHILSFGRCSLGKAQSNGDQWFYGKLRDRIFRWQNGISFLLIRSTSRQLCRLKCRMRGCAFLYIANFIVPSKESVDCKFHLEKMI